MIGLFAGECKPNDSVAFLADLVKELIDLSSNGLTHDGHNYRIHISNIVCDTPARSFVKNTKGHAGYFACDKCTQEGEYLIKSQDDLS